jgi:hypothetical protein
MLGSLGPARRTCSAFGKREGQVELAQTRKSKDNLDKHAETSAERLGTRIIRIRIFFGRASERWAGCLAMPCDGVSDS